MLRMDQYEHIRTANRVYGHSVSKISRDTGHSRNTVRKALNGEYPGYSPRQRQECPVLNPFHQIIDEWLSKDKEQPKKQRHTARRIYLRLLNDYGYTGSESNIRRYVRKAKTRLSITLASVFIPLEPEIGKEAEVDWGTVVAIIGGEQVTLKYFCMRPKFSGKPFIRMYPCERQQAFFDGHIHAFAFYGGVFPLLVYDNLNSAVRKVLQGKNRIEQESFVRFRSYYNFTARFCNVGQGHEKGGVEGLVGFARRNYLVPVPEAESIEELNERLLKECLAYGTHRINGREQPVSELFDQEVPHLLPLPQTPFSNLQILATKADKFSTVIVDKNRYSVPTHYVGWPLRAICLVERIEIFCEGKKIASHLRNFGNNKWLLDPDHYLELLQQRPLAFNSARPIRDWKKRWPDSMNKLLERLCAANGENRGIKDFISVLFLFREYPAKDVYAAVDLAIETGVGSSEGVRHILMASREIAIKAVPLECWSKLPPADVSVYAMLGGVR